MSFVQNLLSLAGACNSITRLPLEWLAVRRAVIMAASSPRPQPLVLGVELTTPSTPCPLPWSTHSLGSCELQYVYNVGRGDLVKITRDRWWRGLDGSKTRWPVPARDPSCKTSPLTLPSITFLHHLHARRAWNVRARPAPPAHQQRCGGGPGKRGGMKALMFFCFSFEAAAAYFDPVVGRCGGRGPVSSIIHSLFLSLSPRVHKREQAH